MTSVAVIGLGRVGLPLALSFADRGVEVIGVERDASVLRSLESGQMPFHETGTQELLERVLANGGFRWTERATDAAEVDHFVLTLGTPALVHLEIDVSQIRARSTTCCRCCARATRWCCAPPSRPAPPSGWPATSSSAAASPSARTCSSPTCRSASPRTTSSRRSPRCPPSSAAWARARGERAASLFEVFGTEIVHTTPVQAELAKIWTNILRYAQFALPNLLMMECEQYGANVFDVVELINHDYPRGGMEAPGLTAGTCLRKDFAFSEERSQAPGHAAGGLARARDGAAVPGRRPAQAARLAARPQGRRARA